MSAMSYLPTRQPASFFLYPTTTNEIEEKIDNLKSSKATGSYIIPTEILKVFKVYLSKPLEIIFNKSLSTGTVPDHFKVASVIPVLKCGSQICLNNYRPISLLSIFNRLLEKLTFERASNFVDKHNILYKNNLVLDPHILLHRLSCRLPIVSKKRLKIRSLHVECSLIYGRLLIQLIIAF